MNRTVYSLLCVLLAASCASCGDSSGGGLSASLHEIDAGASGTTLSHARFSPDGQRLALVRDDGDVGQVVTMKTDGSDLQVVADGADYLTAPTWSADGQTIIYNGDEIYRIKPDGTGQETLFSAFAAQSPDLSPDGTQIVYAVNGGDIEIKTLDSQDPAESLGVSGNSPRFSPDGTQIAYATSEAIRVMDPQGANARDVITGDLSYLSSLDWFPDGERLAITSDRGIEIVGVSDGSRSLLVDQFAAKAIDIGPDGHSLVYGINGQAGLTLADGF